MEEDGEGFHECGVWALSFWFDSVLNHSTYLRSFFLFRDGTVWLAQRFCYSQSHHHSLLHTTWLLYCDPSEFALEHALYAGLGMQLRQDRNVSLGNLACLRVRRRLRCQRCTPIRYQIHVDSNVSLTIYNILGQVVATLVDGVVSAGYQSAEWNAANFASGLYFYKIETKSVTDPSKTLMHVNSWFWWNNFERGYYAFILLWLVVYSHSPILWLLLTGKRCFVGSNSISGLGHGDVCREIILFRTKGADRVTTTGILLERPYRQGEGALYQKHRCVSAFAGRWNFV